MGKYYSGASGYYPEPTLGRDIAKTGATIGDLMMSITSIQRDALTLDEAQAKKAERDLIRDALDNPEEFKKKTFGAIETLMSKLNYTDEEIKNVEVGLFSSPLRTKNDAREMGTKEKEIIYELVKSYGSRTADNRGTVYWGGNGESFDKTNKVKDEAKKILKLQGAGIETQSQLAQQQAKTADTSEEYLKATGARLSAEKEEARAEASKKASAGFAFEKNGIGQYMHDAGYGDDAKVMSSAIQLDRKFASDEAYRMTASPGTSREAKKAYFSGKRADERLNKAEDMLAKARTDRINAVEKFGEDSPHVLMYDATIQSAMESVEIAKEMQPLADKGVTEGDAMGAAKRIRGAKQHVRNREEAAAAVQRYIDGEYDKWLLSKPDEFKKFVAEMKEAGLDKYIQKIEDPAVWRPAQLKVVMPELKLGNVFSEAQTDPSGLSTRNTSTTGSGIGTGFNVAPPQKDISPEQIDAMQQQNESLGRTSFVPAEMAGAGGYTGKVEASTDDINKAVADYKKALKNNSKSDLQSYAAEQAATVEDVENLTATEMQDLIRATKQQGIDVDKLSKDELMLIIKNIRKASKGSLEDFGKSLVD